MPQNGDVIVTNIVYQSMAQDVHMHVINYWFETGGRKYLFAYIILSNEFTRFMWLFLLNKKDIKQKA